MVQEMVNLNQHRQRLRLLRLVLNKKCLNKLHLLHLDYLLVVNNFLHFRYQQELVVNLNNLRPLNRLELHQNYLVKFLLLLMK
jgi:hypothetical protein